MATMLNPSIMRQSSVSGMIWSRSACSTAAPTSGPRERLDTADEQHGEGVDGCRNAEHGRVDGAARERVEPARQAGGGARQDEGEPAMAADGQSDGFRAPFGIAGGPQRVAERRVDDPREREDRSRDERKGQEVIGFPARRP